MSRIDDLIQELCPDGVERRPLGSLGKRNKGTAITASKMKAIGGGGPIRVFAGGQTVADVAEDAIPATDVVRVPSIIVKSRGHIGFSYYERPFTHKTELWSYTIDVAGVDQKFIYYYLLTQIDNLQALARATSVKLPQLSVRDTDTLRVPVPPLEVQREIVRVLDAFTQLEAELEAELEARRTQYQHYLRSVVLPDGEIEWTTLDEATLNLDRKRRPVTRADRQGGEYPYYGANGVQDYVHDYIFDGTFLLVGEDGSVKNVDGTPILNWAVGKIWVNNHAHVLTAAGKHFNLRYLYHYLATVDVTTYVTGGTQPKINQKNLNKIPVPLVPRSYQDEVVSVLDKFDALVNDISLGLPAELAARRKQYEHYRDRLLTFKELTA
ncbi:restriction endonuclease subunit S [Brevibacterium luteolum]|uniref:restriction endonuclease subunit S n=1 Tax=Brevibacterium luteolum TaxID=199591 RepID=UPI0038793AE4